MPPLFPWPGVPVPPGLVLGKPAKARPPPPEPPAIAEPAAPPPIAVIFNIDIDELEPIVQFPGEATPGPPAPTTPA